MFFLRVSVSLFRPTFQLENNKRKEFFLQFRFIQRDFLATPKFMQKMFRALKFN